MDLSFFFHFFFSFLSYPLFLVLWLLPCSKMLRNRERAPIVPHEIDLQYDDPFISEDRRNRYTWPVNLHHNFPID